MRLNQVLKLYSFWRYIIVYASITIESSSIVMHANNLDE